MFNEENKEVAQLGRVHQKGQKAPCTAPSTHTAHNRIIVTAGRRSTGARQASNGEVKRRVFSSLSISIRRAMKCEGRRQPIVIS